MKNILILNGSLGGDHGNTEELITLSQKYIQQKGLTSEVIHLSAATSLSDIEKKIKTSAGLIFTSGTYWDSWGSPMQKFLEEATVFEASDMLLGKSAAVIITMHSVGGKGVLSRLQGVLNTLGFLIPPMSGMVYSLATHLAKDIPSSFAEDFWSLEDVEIVVHNLVTSINNKNDFQAWPVDKKDAKRVWLNS
jgi:flavorubredoxin